MNVNILHWKRAARTVLLILLLSAVGMTKALALDFTEGNLTYTVNEGGTSVTVTGHADGTSATGALDIPESVTHGAYTYAVTDIEDYAFSGCSGLTSVTIPASMTSIGDDAFENCSGLLVLNYNATNCSLGWRNYCDYSYRYYHWLYGCNSLVSLNIGENVQTIPDYFVGSYYGYGSLVGTLIIPNSVTTIGNYAFYGCSGFASVVIGNAVTTIGNYAFHGCYGFATVTFGNSVTTIGDSAFGNCSSLTTVVIPDSVVSLGSDAFYGCTGLTSATIGSSVTSLGGTFSGCTSLSSVTIGNSVVSMGNSVFYGCTSLTSVTIPNSVLSMGSHVFYECSNLASVTIGNYVVSIGDQVFKNCTSLTSINIPASVVSLGTELFGGCTALGQITVASGNPNYDSRNNCNAIIQTVSNKLVAGCKNTVIPNTVVTIGERAFSGCTSLIGTVNIPNSVTSIEYEAFSGCTGLVGALNIPNSVTSIGDVAFMNCSGLTSVTIPASVTSIGKSVFSNCTNLVSLNYNAINCTIAVDYYSSIYYGHYYYNHWLEGCSSLVNLTIGENVQVIPDHFVYSRNGNSFIGALTIPNSVISIGFEAFYNCYGFSSVVIGNSVTSIDNEAFYGCSGLVTATIGNSVTNIGEKAFYGCYDIASVAFGNSVTFIGNEAFYNCNDLTSVTFPNSVISIGSAAFGSCDDLAFVEIGTSVVTIGSDAFIDCSHLANIITHAETPPTLGSGVFYNVPTDIPVYVPCEGLEDYISANWGGFSNIMGACAGEITVTANPVGGGMVSGGGSYEGGTTCTLSATSYGYLSFLNWTKDGEVVSTNPNYSFIVTGDAFYEANFGQIGTGDEFQIGSGTATNNYLPSYSYYKYSLTQQIYTAGEMGGMPGVITSIAFFNGGSEKTRNYDIYLKHTTKDSFYNNTDWITVSEADKVYSGSVTMAVSGWTTITFDTPFYYDGVSNLALIVDDNTGSWSQGLSCLVFDAEGNQAIYKCNDGTNYDPTNPSGISGTLLSVKNQIKLGMASAIGDNIVFADEAVKALCVGAWDTDGDDELSYAEAAAVTDLGSVFVQNDEITSFNELRYFTGLSAIGANAFNECFALTSIELPVTLSAIGSHAFDGCSALAMIWSHAENPPTLGEAVFNDVNAGIPVYVPCGRAEAYNAVSWGGFSNILELCSGTVTATANPAAGGTVTGGGAFEGGETCTLTATTNTGYTFMNWTKDGNVVCDTEVYSFMVAGTATYVANFSINSYDITATAEPAEGGTVEGAGTYNYGTTATLTATANEGYSFANWTLGGEVVSNSPTYTFTVTEAADYEAHFNINYYQVSVSATPENGGEVAMDGNTTGGSVTQTAYIAFADQGFANGQSVDGLTIDLDENVAVVFEQGTGSSTPKYYTTSASVRCYAGNDFVVSATSGQITSIVLTFGEYDGTNEITTNVGTFDGATWTGEAASVTFNIGGTTGQRRIMAMEVTYSVEGSANQGNFAYGTEVTLTATPNVNEHYIFINWTKDGEVVSNLPTYTFTVTEAGDYVAHFELMSFEVTATLLPEAGGTLSGTGTYNYGSTATLSVAPYAGYNFIHWTMDGEVVSTNATYSFTVMENAHLVAELQYAPAQTLADGWNWYSTYVELEGNNGLEQLENSLGSNGMIIKSRNNGFVEYYEVNGETGWFGSLTALANEQMYMIRTNAACSTAIVGSPSSPENHPITISNGWNWIGYPNSQATNVSTALADFTPANNDVIKGRTGFTTYYSDGGNSQWFGTLNNFEPGQGYMYQSHSTEAKTLTFQTGRGESIVPNITPDDNLFMPRGETFAHNMTVTAIVELDGEEVRSEDYELAAFVGDECRGSVRLMYVEPIDRYIAFLTVLGETAETLSFRLTDGMETSLSLDELTFAIDGMVGTLGEPFAVRFRGLTSLDEDASTSVKVYPNPSEGVYHVEGQGIRKLEVFDGLGQLVLSEETRNDFNLIDLGDRAKGVYVLRVVTDGGVKVSQIIKQ